MAGIYFHIPYCISRCTYCDFYTQTNFRTKTALLDSMRTELLTRKKYIADPIISSIYFGGGTPSTLAIDEIEMFLNYVRQLFFVIKDAEITLEANPDDLNENYLTQLKEIGINRLSVGIQNFDNKKLSDINRRHTSLQAKTAIKTAQGIGIHNISIDLIFGLPGETLESWNKQLQQALDLDVPHLSIYGLTYEKGTKLWKQWQDGVKKQISEDDSTEMYILTQNMLIAADYEHYEVSNFAKEGFRSRHNSNYWNETPYLGIGPAAHSYDGKSRQWNVPSIHKYINSLKNNENYYDVELLSKEDKVNDRIMLSLRTAEGLNLQKFKNNFGEKIYDKLLNDAKVFLERKLLIIANGSLTLSKEGLLIADRIISDLLIID